ncbi:MAG: hypothetical protein C4575_07385 [Desulforudis sp.]|jgi:uncharacterized protein YhjY with autotransporter beta-barrel domain|nr:MAG: hypothetical protein C4575_07385 [Desulforudis sp.]
MVKKCQTPYHEQMARRLEARNWLEEHLQDVQAGYAGKWVGIAGGRVIASGETTPQEVRRGINPEISELEVLICRVPDGPISKPI